MPEEELEEDEDEDLDAYWNDVKAPPLPKIYFGVRDADGNCKVWVQRKGKARRPLPKRLNVFNHSPAGFEWGYSGSGPAQLALAILIDHDPKKGSEWAVRRHQFFKQKIIAALPRDADWTLTPEDVQRAIDAINAHLGVDTKSLEEDPQDHEQELGQEAQDR
jgi:hypothetical protein